MDRFINIITLCGRIVVSGRTLWNSIAELLEITGYIVPMEDGLDDGQEL